MAHGTLQSPETLVFGPLVLGGVGIAICIAVIELARWLGRDPDRSLPRAAVHVRRRLTGSG